MSHRRLAIERPSLYVLLTERRCRRPWRETAELVVAAGAELVQLREKELPDAELLDRACILRELTREAGATLIVNDRPDVAVLSGADGVHIGQDDLPAARVRELVGPDLWIGLSTHSLEQARLACELPVDYVSAGPVAPTATKGYTEGKGLGLVSSVAQACSARGLPVVAIGGMTPESAAAAIEAGASAVAVCSAVCAADNPFEAVQRLRASLQAASSEPSDE